MPTRNNRKSGIAHRRRLVGQLRSKDLTAQGIVAELARSGIVNPATGKPYSLRTIISDLVELQIDQIAQANETTHSIRGRLVAETRKARRQACMNKDYAAVLRSIEVEAALYGLLQCSGSVDNGPVRIVSVHHPVSQCLCGLVSAGQGPDLPLEEKAIAQDKYEDRVSYAGISPDRRNVEPVLPILEGDFREIS